MLPAHAPCGEPYVRGYAVPLRDAPHLHRITGFALFATAVPASADYNTAVVGVEGTVDMASGTIDVEGRAVGAGRASERAGVSRAG